MPIIGVDPDFEIVGETITDDELRELRRLRGDDNYYVTAPRVDPVQDRCTDRQICLLGPFLKFEQPPDPSTLQEIFCSHPVLAARPGGICERHAIEALICYCSEKGPAWTGLEVVAKRLLASLAPEPRG